MVMSDKTKEARNRLMETLKNASPEVRQAFRESVEETREYFKREDVIKDITDTVNSVREVMLSGKIGEIAREHERLNGCSF